MLASNRLLPFSAFLCLALAGCEQNRPPTAEGLRKIAQRTASGTKNTKLEARVHPETPRAGEFSFWDLKVFDIQDQPDGTRVEWKFFNDLPQSSTDATISEVLMNAWLISRDGQVFLPARPKYQAYGSFNTDWTIPRAGPYTLFVEYQPRKKGKIVLPVEIAQWNFPVASGSSTQKPVRKSSNWSPTHNPLPITLGGAPDGEPAGTLNIENLPTSAKETKSVKIQGAPNGATGMELVALSAGGAFCHFPRNADGTFAVRFDKPEMVRLWAYFTLNGALYAAPMNQLIS